MAELARMIPAAADVYNMLAAHLTPSGAFFELVDNAGDAGADTVIIELGPTSVAVIDNGGGVQDMNAPFWIGKSGSRSKKNALGQFGWGAKAAAACFGQTATVKTVIGSVYRTFTVDWSGEEYPYEYDGKDLSAIKAPASIRAGGTKITITKLIGGRGHYNIPDLVDALSFRYFPAIQAGAKIILRDTRKSDHTEIILAPTLKLYGSQKTVAGVAAGRKFSVQFGDAEEHDPLYCGELHLAFMQRRIIQSVKKLCGEQLPSKTFVMVTLTGDWKDCLSLDKSKVIKYRKELLSEVHLIIKDWLGNFEKANDELELEEFNGRLSALTENLLRAPGTGFGRERRKSGGGHGSCGGIGGGDGHSSETVKRDTEGDKGAEEIDAPRRGIKFAMVSDLGNIPYRVTTAEDGTVTVSMSDQVPSVRNGYAKPPKEEALLPIMGQALANYFRSNPEERPRLSPKCRESVSRHEAYPDTYEKYLFTWFAKAFWENLRGTHKKAVGD